MRKHHPNRVVAARADLITFHHEFSTTADGAEFVAGLLEDARALWDVRVLDAWADATNADTRVVASHGGFRVALDMRDFHLTREAARHAAALAVFPSLPADVRDKLGECP